MRRKVEVFVGTFVGSGRQYPTARASPAGKMLSQQDDIFPAGGVLLPPLHAFEPQEIPPADEVVFGGGGIAAAGGAAEAGVEHTPPVPAIGGCADVDAQGLIPPGGQGRGSVAGGAEVHFHQIDPHRCKTAPPGQHGAGDPLQLRQMGWSAAGQAVSRYASTASRTASLSVWSAVVSLAARMWSRSVSAASAAPVSSWVRPQPSRPCRPMQSASAPLSVMHQTVIWRRDKMRLYIKTDPFSGNTIQSLGLWE